MSVLSDNRPMLRLAATIPRPGDAPPFHETQGDACGRLLQDDARWRPVRRMSRSYPRYGMLLVENPYYSTVQFLLMSTAVSREAKGHKMTRLFTMVAFCRGRPFGLWVG